MYGLLKDRARALVLARLRSGNRPAAGASAVLRTWGMDLTGLPLVAFGTFGKPAAVRCDNDAVFKTFIFRVVLSLLGVQQQFTQVASPWQNGRIERLWRTLKKTLGTQPQRWSDGVRVVQTRMKLASLAAMAQVLDAFKAHYNHARPHQSLNGRTPAMVWNEQVGKRLAKAQVNPAMQQRSRAPPD